jgi:glutamate dehydrogenase/leucine dehydrogenase
MAINNLLEQYKSKKPLIIFEWHDLETDAEGWVVINSLRGGAAGGGTRMRKGLNCEEVIALAKVMEIKFTVSGPPIGGAKSGINFDPSDPRRDEVLRRWFMAVTPLLKQYYGTGGDLNVDELKQVIPITEDFGLWHPQEGVVNGHINPSRSGDKIKLLGQLRQGVSKIIEDERFAPKVINKKFCVADMITGYGVAQSVKHYYRLYHKSSLVNKRVIVQGWGNVAGAAGYYLAQEGALITAIADLHHGLIAPNGLNFAEVHDLFVRRDQMNLSPIMPKVKPTAEVLPFIWDTPCDIFIPTAASKLVQRSHLDRMLAAGLQCISCGANDPFADNDLVWGATSQYVDGQCALIPDFIANCGMARVFAYLMQPNAAISDEAIFNDTEQTVSRAIEAIFAQNPQNTGFSETALNIALKKLAK